MEDNTTLSPGEINRDITITTTDVCMFLFALCLAAFITSANATTIVAIWRTPALRTLANIYVCSLACADFVVGAMCVLLALFLLPPLRDSWFDRSDGLCSFFYGMNVGMTAISASNMTLIALDRYLYIIRPYFYQRVINTCVISTFISVSWTLGLIIALMPQFIARPSSEVPLCNITRRLPTWYLFHMSASLYSFTVFADIIFYSFILRAAARQRKAIRVNVASQVQQGNEGVDGNFKGDSHNITKGTMKSIKFFLTVFGFFFCSLTPMAVVMAVDNYVDVYSGLYRVLNLIAVLNSGTNFIIYAVMNKQFRQAFLQTTLLARCGKSFLKADG
ncbi:beta-2 adrenergic receptor [Plakobranchus ocellatus]|uniref:Beta-2 adrenergic receptor n=1 Tax=Plakobranchus ocellatus TaxID=259542 RepID=A0AAV4DYY8_9GAST|nr:beta-2 adrenergic receptor [Plakobranchus ocellatus]